ncbi:hypothetical protein RN001_000772 [Aquatica leii]|uniref:Uncharacterized protein n=1 Tax=Aquatica leii TaxID=1421715 RepID=A0AAN7PKJ1_9COLE|nr:hypothetical protein RN001_000772 [Aquatica leii]
MEKLILQRETVVEKLDRLNSFIDTYTGDKKNELNARLIKAENWYDEFEIIQGKIENADKEGINKAENAEQRNLFENKYFKLIGIAKALIDSKKDLLGVLVNLKRAMIIFKERQESQMQMIRVPSTKMDVNRLLSDDLDFELKRRGIPNEGTIDDKRAKLRARMRVEREVNVSFPKLVIDTQEQLQICNTKLVDLESEIVSSGQPMAQNEYKRIKSRLIHVYNRLEVVSQPDNKSLVEKCLQLLDCLDQKCQIAVPENPAVVSEDPVPLPEPVSHEEDTPVMPSWRDQMRRFSTWENTNDHAPPTSEDAHFSTEWIHYTQSEMQKPSHKALVDFTSKLN